MPTKADLPEIRTALADVGRIDAQGCAAAAVMSLSQWNAVVARGIAPAPIIRQPRYTRWLLADVCQFLIESTQLADETASDLSMGKAKKASAAARANRDANRQATS